MPKNLMIMNDPVEILGIIPARKNSKGLPGKNIYELNGIPLIAHTIIEAKKSKLLTRLAVITDGPEIAEISKSYGAEVPFLRPPQISQDQSHAFEVYKYTLEWFKQNQNYTPEILCVMLCTTPLRTVQDIDQCLLKIINSGCDWCFTINEIEHHPWRSMVVDGDRMKPLFDISRKQLWSNRQELPRIYRFNGGVIAAKSQHIFEHDEYNIDNLDCQNTDVRSVIMPPARSLDIDTLDDLKLVEFVMKNQGLRK